MMEIQEAFLRYERRESCAPGEIRSTVLALRRGGVDTVEQLRTLYGEDRDRLKSLRGIGPLRIRLIGQVLRFWGETGRNTPGL